jgi:hypothetical protein
MGDFALNAANGRKPNVPLKTNQLFVDENRFENDSFEGSV